MKYVCLHYGLRAHRHLSAATLRFEQGRLEIEDGPACESNSRLDRVVVLEADDLNHLIALLSREPVGTVEIRVLED